MTEYFGQQIMDILKAELSEITAVIILGEEAVKIGKSPDAIVAEDLKILQPLIMSAVLLLGGRKKAQVIKEKLDALGHRHLAAL